MGLLDRHVSVLKSEEVVLGVGEPWIGEGEQAGKESTSIVCVAKPSKKGWTGYGAVTHKVKEAAVGLALKGKAFPARCLISFERHSDEKRSSFNGRENVQQIEVLVAVGVEYLGALDLVEVRVPPLASDKKAA